MGNVKVVIEDKRCMSCGACSSVCSVDAIDMAYIEQEGFYRPSLDEAKCVGCGKCMKVCPAEHQEKSSLMGEFRKLYLAHTTDENVRHWATSGGVINALARYLLDKNIAEAVLMTCYSADSPVEAQPILITRDNVSILVRNPRDFASRYVTIPVLSKLKEVSNMTSIAVVGTSCQTTALNMLGGVEVT